MFSDLSLGEIHPVIFVVLRRIFPRWSGVVSRQSTYCLVILSTNSALYPHSHRAGGSWARTYTGTAFTIAPVHCLALSSTALDVMVWVCDTFILFRVDLIFVRHSSLPGTVSPHPHQPVGPSDQSPEPRQWDREQYSHFIRWQVSSFTLVPRIQFPFFSRSHFI